MHFSEVFVALSDVSFRRDHLKRSMYADPRGTKRWFGVPVNGSTRTPYRDIAISPNFEPQGLLRTLEHNYRKSPKFEENFPYVRKYLSFYHANESLLKANMNSSVFLMEALGLNSPKMVLSEEVTTNIDRTDRVIDICQAFEGRGLLVGDGGMTTSHDFNRINRSKIPVFSLPFYTKHPEYRQFQLKSKASIFVPGVSCIDAILNIGRMGVKSLVLSTSPLIQQLRC